MKIPGLKLRTILIVLVVLLIAGGTGLWLSLPGLINGKIVSALHEAGFKDARVGKVDVYYNATHIQNIRLTGTKDAPGIGKIEVYYSLGNLLGGHIDRIFLDEIKLSASDTGDGLAVTGMAPSGGNSGDTDIPALLSDIPVDAIELRSADFEFDLQGDAITINLAGRMARGPSGDHGIHGRLRGRSKNADIAAKLEGAVEKDGTLKLALNIDEASIDHPLISTNRFTGWANLEIDKASKPELNTEIAAGVLNIGGTELRGVTLTYRQQNEAHHFITRAKAADSAGDFIVDYDATPADGGFDVSATLSATDAELAQIRQLPAMTGRNIAGLANVDLTAHCHSPSPIPAGPADCSSTGGKGMVNLSRFAAEGLFSDAVAKLDLRLASPEGGGIQISSPAGAEISLLPGADFPVLETVTGFAGERLTVNLSTQDDVAPYIALLADGRLQLGGGFTVSGRDGNAVQGKIGALTISPAAGFLPDLTATDTRLNIALAAIDTKTLQSQNAVFEYTGDIRLDANSGTLSLMPDTCVTFKAEKLNTDFYRPQNAFDACIPLAKSEEGTTPADWLKLGLSQNADDSIVVSRLQYNGGIPALPIDLQLEDEDGPYRVSGRLPKGEISVELDESFMPAYVKATFSGGGHVVTSKAPFSLTGFDGSVVYRAPSSDAAAQLDTKLEISKFAHTVNRRPYFMPLGLSFESSTDLTSQEMAFNASAMDDVGTLVIELAGTHNLAKDSGTGAFKIYPVDFGLIAPSMEDVFPVLRNWINKATGKLSVDTALTWSKIFEETPVIDGTGTITLADAVLDTQDIAAAGINAKITLKDVWPLTLPPGQSLTVKAADIGIPLTDGDISFSLTADNILDVARFNWQLADGVIKTDPFAMPLDTLDKTIRLQASNIDLAKLAIMADIDGLEATGILNGDIPVKVSPQGFDIDKGLLKAAGNGVIRYNPDEVPPALAGSNQQITTVRDALKNLQYKDLSMEISGGSEGSQNIALHISGKNPDFYGGHPVELNLNLDGDLGALIRQSLNALGYTDQIIRDTLENQSEIGNTE